MEGYAYPIWSIACWPAAGTRCCIGRWSGSRPMLLPIADRAVMGIPPSRARRSGCSGCSRPRRLPFFHAFGECAVAAKSVLLPAATVQPAIPTSHGLVQSRLGAALFAYPRRRSTVPDAEDAANGGVRRLRGCCRCSVRRRTVDRPRDSRAASVAPSMWRAQLAARRMRWIALAAGPSRPRDRGHRVLTTDTRPSVPVWWPVANLPSDVRSPFSASVPWIVASPMWEVGFLSLGPSRVS